MYNKLLSFGAKNVNPVILEQTLTVRKGVVDTIEKKCSNRILEGTTYQSLLIAPRGSGKTHIIKVLYHRFKNNKKMVKKAVIAYMSEDEVGIANFTDLFISILRSFVRYNEIGSEVIEDKIREASLIQNKEEQAKFIKNILNDFADKRIIILLIENFDKILKTLVKKEQAKLRDFVHQYNNLSIIATSQSLIESLQKSTYPFYNFFNVKQLKKLNFNESVDLLTAIAKAEKEDNLLKEIKNPKFEGKLRAIYELTEGNHRLLVTFFSFLKAEYRYDLSEIFVKTMNDLKPYYEQFINPLPAQQQKIIKYLSGNRNAVMGKIIAQDCFISSNTLSSQMSSLFKMGMIDKHKSGKDTFYELKEPLMRISFEISENSNGIAKLFIDFLSSIYEPKSIKNQYLKYKYGAKFQIEELQKKYANEAKMYEMALSSKELKNLDLFDKIFSNIKNTGELDKKITKVEEATLREKILSFKDFKQKFEFEPEEFADLMISSIMFSYDEKIAMIDSFDRLKKEHLLNYIKAFEEEKYLIKRLGADIFIEVQKRVRSGEEKDGKRLILKTINMPKFRNNEKALSYLGLSFYSKNEFKEAIDKFKKAIKINPTNAEYCFYLGKAYQKNNKYEYAVANFEKAIELDSDKIKYYRELSIILLEKDKYKKAIPVFEKLIKLAPNETNYYKALVLILALNDENKKAIKYATKYIKLNPSDESSYHILAVCYFEIKDYRNSIINLNKLISLSPNYKDAYDNLGLAYLKVNNIKEAIISFDKAIELNPKNINTKFSLLGLYIQTNNLEKSKNSLVENIEIADDELLKKSLTDDILFPLFKHGSSFFMKEYFVFLINILEKNKKLPLLWGALSESYFSVLRTKEEYDLERLHTILSISKEVLASYSKSIIPLKMFEVGIDYLKVGDKNAIYSLSKEERKIFTTSVLEKDE